MHVGQQSSSVASVNGVGEGRHTCTNRYANSVYRAGTEDLACPQHATVLRQTVFI